MKQTAYLFLILCILFSCKDKEPLTDSVIADPPFPPHDKLTRIEESPDNITKFDYNIIGELNLLTFLKKDQISSFTTFILTPDKQILTYSNLDSAGVQIISEKSSYYYTDGHLISHGTIMDSIYAIFESNKSVQIVKKSEYKNSKKVNEIVYDYDYNNNMTHETHYEFSNGDTTKSHEIAYEYDSRYNPLKYIFPKPFPTELQLYSDHNVIKKSATYPATNATDITFTSYTYDVFGFPLSSLVSQPGRIV